MQKIVFTVTNDLTFDQRMQRICGSMAAAGYDVLLVGRKLPSSTTFHPSNFKYKRIACWLNKGIGFYAEYNIRLFFLLLFIQTDAFCAVDLDTIIPNYFAAAIRRKKRMYDAHELFTEQKEIVVRPLIHKIWLAVEAFAVPKFAHGYTVNEFIKTELYKRYKVQYHIIRNLPKSNIDKKSHQQTTIELPNKFIIYQGAVNEGRSFETLIPAMKQFDIPLLICGEGNFYEQTKALIQHHQVEEKVIMLGYVAPDELKLITPKALFGLTLFEKTGLNQYYSLSNRFFDYTMANIPQVCVGYPEYKAINDIYPTALLIDNVGEQTIADAMNKLRQDNVLYKILQENCEQASAIFNWENEEKKLVEYWKGIFKQHG